MKNHVRKALALLLAATMAVSMTACGGGKRMMALQNQRKTLWQQRKKAHRRAQAATKTRLSGDRALT
ncbi:MAG: hypothetical protein ACLR6I_08615 [Waltera sp.]